jgi:hypothetical protein
MRNYNDPQYKKFRNEVRNRDGKQCKWPGCCAKKRLQVHHIMSWAHFPAMRFLTANGITLCRKHHDIVKGKEMQFAQLFINLIR